MAKKDAAADKIAILKKKSMVPEKYEFELLSTSESVEPFYFWLIDFMKILGFTVEKVGETMGASVVSGFFGEMSMRREKLEEQGMRYLQTVNTIVKSVINLLYDLREFDRRLNVYDDVKSEEKEKKEAAALALKRIWMDEVDIRKGRASINSLSLPGTREGLEFVTLRDAFMMAKEVEDVDSMDLNDRVKRVLKGRVEEYNNWKKESEKELRQRRKIELTYLKSQVESLRLYTLWAKPYLKAAQTLQFKDTKMGDPQLVQAFDQNYIELIVRGVKKYYLKEFLTPSANQYSYVPPNLLTDEQQAVMKRVRAGAYALGVIELKFTYRARPWLPNPTEMQRHYVTLGKMNIEFKGYVMREDEYELLKKKEEDEALGFIEGITQESLVTLREDIEKYLGELDIEDKQEKKEKQLPILDRILSGGVSKEKIGGGIPLADSGSYFMEERAKALAKRTVALKLWDLYDIFKKAHRLMAFPYPPDWFPKTPPKPIK